MGIVLHLLFVLLFVVTTGCQMITVLLAKWCQKVMELMHNTAPTPQQEASWEYGFAYEDSAVSVKKVHS